MARSRIVLFLAAVLILGAGFVLGRISARMHDGPPRDEGRPSWLADQLDLSRDQRAKMDAIWAETKQKIGKTFDERRAIGEERDKAIESLLDDKQRATYADILKKADERRAALGKERDAIVEKANEQSRELLDARQKERWEALTRQARSREHRGWRGPSSRPGGPPPDGMDRGHMPPRDMPPQGMAPHDMPRPGMPPPPPPDAP